jgi:hypothetical protein
LELLTSLLNLEPQICFEKIVWGGCAVFSAYKDELHKKIPKISKVEFCLLEHNAVQSAGSQLTFWRILLPSSSGLKSKPSKKQA